MSLLYYYISFLSGVVELGCVFWGLRKEFSMLMIVGLVFAYQLGNIIQYYIPKKVEHYSQYYLMGSLLTCILGEFTSEYVVVQYILAFVTLLIDSTFLQLERESVKGIVKEWEKWKKRACRVVGFFVASAMYSDFGTWILALSILTLIIIGFIGPDFGYDRWFSNFTKKGQTEPKICLAMITHQAHYFVYTYVLCMFVYYEYNNALIASIWFVLNWIPYTITEPLVKVLKIEKYYNTIGIVAHIFNGIVLIGVFLFLDNSHILAAVLLWMLTGFGGGNIFCVRKGMSKYVNYDNDTWMYSEQVGHVLGMISCIILVAFNIPEYTMIASAVFAFVTVPIIIATINHYKKEKTKNA